MQTDNLVCDTGAMITFGPRPDYMCPKHGITKEDYAFFTTIDGDKAVWCLKCMVETLETIGVHKLTKVEHEP